jgi:hypothetical protein
MTTTMDINPPLCSSKVKNLLVISCYVRTEKDGKEGEDSAKRRYLQMSESVEILRAGS